MPYCLAKTVIVSASEGTLSDSSTNIYKTSLDI